MRHFDDVLNLFKAAHRKTRATERNATSSRSHAIATIRVQHIGFPDGAGPEPGVLRIIDLAGSERAADSGKHDKQTMTETKCINSSTSLLLGGAFSLSLSRSLARSLSLSLSRSLSLSLALSLPPSSSSSSPPSPPIPVQLFSLARLVFYSGFHADVRAQSS